MYFVYILKSAKFPEQKYVGCTTDLKKRLSNHNAGASPHTNKYKPWKVAVSISFEEKELAVKFEKYLKSCSGRAFASKRLLNE